MHAVEPSRLIALKIWWSFYWRSLALFFAIVMGLGVVFGIGAAVFGARGERLSAVISAAMGVAAIPAFIVGSVQGMDWTLRKKFSDFEIALLPRQD